jgi:hypothetical protein
MGTALQYEGVANQTSPEGNGRDRPDKAVGSS